MRHYHKILVLILLFAQACDRVKDTPEPDYFQDFEPKKISVTTEPGQNQVWVNILDYNQIKAEYRLEIGEPGHGVLSAGFVPGGYLYTAESGFSGTDSVTYQICLGTFCKPGVIYFHVLGPKCRTRAFNDEFNFILRDTLIVPVMANDSATCGGVFLKSISNYSGPGNPKISNNSVQLELPDYFEGTVTFSYTIGNSDSSSTAQVEVHVSINEAYCDARFSPVNDTLFFYNKFNFRVFKPEELITNDIRCVSYTNIASFDIPNPPSTSGYELKKQNDRWWFLVKDTSSFTSGTFQYRLCTNSGTCRTATVVIRKP